MNLTSMTLLNYNRLHFVQNAKHVAMPTNQIQDVTPAVVRLVKVFILEQMAEQKENSKWQTLLSL